MDSHEQAWTTVVLPESDQFSFWREVVWDAFVPVTLSRGEGAGFSGAVGASRVGSLSVAAIASEPQTVERTAADLRRSPGEVFFLNMPLRGRSTVSQDGREAELAPGDFAVVDGTRPFTLDFEEEFEQLSLVLPHELLFPLLTRPEMVTATAVRGDAGLGAATGGALRPFYAGVGIDAALGRALSERLVSLVALALGAGALATGSPDALTQAALDEVERSLGDPNLSPALVASRVGVSTRYLHQLFSTRGPSFSRWVAARRLERTRADLADPGLAHLTIGEIGWRNGFTDPSYLARAYRRAYGVSPGEYRGAHSAEGPSPARFRV